MAVVGLAGRFPGAEGVGEFWENLVGGVESVRRFSPEEVGQGDGAVAVSGVLEHVESFDAKFFGLSDREAELMDPAQRLFLEVCHQALEHGGYAGTSGRVGVFAGSGMNLYNRQHQSRDSLATRVAYRLGLTGPAPPAGQVDGGRVLGGVRPASADGRAGREAEVGERAAGEHV